MDTKAPQRPPEVSDAVWARALRSEGKDRCALGYHAWVPWMELPSGSLTTWCARQGCDHQEQYDF